jgi:diguanylate cyclase (GGDEF)-like protein
VAVNYELSIVCLAIQAVGIALLAVLTFLLTQSIRRQFLDCWAVAWSCLGVALSSLLIAICLPLAPRPFYALYFYGEYVFGFFLVVGCRHFTQDRTLRPSEVWPLGALAVVAAGLPHLTDDLDILLVPHGALFAGIWACALAALRPRLPQPGFRSGLRVARVALSLLVLQFVHYAVMCGYARSTGLPNPLPYLRYSSLVDLILEMLLGFGIVMMVMEHVHGELERSNRELQAATQRLQAMVERDPLTEALNRHAFHTLLERSERMPGRKLSGSVAILDVDEFKAINDTYGHAAGDAAIRSVARALRDVIRADDLLFRWGGDEFLVLLLGLGEDESRLRLEHLNTSLGTTKLPGCKDHAPLAVSFGVASFGHHATLEHSIELADQEMYQQKHRRRTNDEQRVPSAAARCEE